MAPQHPPAAIAPPRTHAIPLHRFHGVFRTSRHVAARRRKRRRNPPLIKPQQPKRERLHFSISISFFAIASSARPTSSSTTENSKVSTDFFGLITTSTARAAPCEHRPPPPHCFAQPPLDPVPLHRAAQHAAHREPDARALFRQSSFRQSQPAVKRPPPAADRTRSCAEKSAAVPACTRDRSRSASAAAPSAESLRLRRGLLFTPLRSVSVHQLTILKSPIVTDQQRAPLFLATGD